MTKQETRTLEKFLIKTFSLSADSEHISQGIRMANKYNPPLGHITLFNPLTKLSNLLGLFYSQDKLKGIPCDIDPDLYEHEFSHINGHETQYLFSCPTRVTPFNCDQFPTVAKAVEYLKDRPAMTMTISEAIIYFLFCRSAGVLTPFGSDSVITRTYNEYNVPIVIGFDQNEICNKIQLCNSEVLNESLVTKEISQSKVVY